MESKIKITHKIGLLSIITSLLFGTFLSASLFALLLQAFGQTGIWIGLVLSALIIFAGFYYTKKRTHLRYITWGILGTIVIAAATFIIALEYLDSELSNLGL